MKNAVQINEVYISHSKDMVIMEQGVLSLDGVSVINAFRRAVEAEKKAIKESSTDKVSKACKSN